jgi:hypothetical protein
MGNYDDRRTAAARKAMEGIAGDSALPPEIARVFSRGLIKDWVNESIDWEPDWSRLSLEQALRLVQAARVLDELGQQQEALPAWRRAGELLEWLSRAEDSLRTEVPIALLAAAAFQLGQLPAMSAALLERDEVKQWESPIHAAFLAGDFSSVLDLVVSFWAARAEYTGLTGSAELLEKGDATSAFVVHELVRCLGLVAGSLQDGNTKRLAQGLAKLSEVSAWAQSSTAPATALLVDLEVAVAARYARHSIFFGLAPFADGGTQQRRSALDRFARGLVADGKALMWPSQKRGIERLASGESFAICTPTGSGKTIVALLAVLVETVGVAPRGIAGPHSLGQVGKLALYLVPSRALAMEVEREARTRLGPCGLIVSSLYGGVDWGSQDLDLSGPAPRLLVTTVEKAEALWRLAGTELEPRLRILIVDEAHQVVFRGATQERLLRLASGEDRSLRLEAFVSRLVSKRPKLRKVAVSAVAGDAESLLAAWLGSPGSTPVSPPGRSVRQIVGRLELKGTTYRVTIDRYNGVQPENNESARFLALKIPILPAASPAVLRDNAYARADAMSIWVGTRLAMRQRRVLIAVGSKLPATLSRTLTALKSRAWAAAGSGTQSWFEAPTGDSAELFRQALAALECYMGPDSYDSDLLTRGVAAHHGQLPEVPRRLVTSLIRLGVIRVVVATSTLSEGVNLPFDIVLHPVAGRRRSREVGRRRTWYIEPYSAEEFANLSGRAGRPGVGRSMEGLSVVAMPDGDDGGELETAYQTVLRRLTDVRSEEENAESPLEQLTHWIELLARKAGITGDALTAWLEAVSPESLSGPLLDAVDALDQVILSAVAEAESAEGRDLTAVELEARLQSLWSASFAAATRRFEDRAREMIQARGAGVVRVYQPRPARRRLYLLGLPPARGQNFLATCAALEGYLRAGEDYAKWSDLVRGDWLAGVVEVLRLDPALGFKPPGDLKGLAAIQANWKAHLRWWLGLVSEYPSGAELYDVLRFVQDQFDFRTGVAVAAVLADAWEKCGARSGATNPDAWQKATGLPWICYWIRDLLRYGTVSPLCAHVLAAQRAVTRARAKEFETQFHEWLDAEGHTDPQERMRPQRIREWERHAFIEQATAATAQRVHVKIEVDQQFAGYSERLMAWPADGQTETTWFEPGGYRIGRSVRVDEAADPEWRKRAFFGVVPSEGVVRWRKL